MTTTFNIMTMLDILGVSYTPAGTWLNIPCLFEAHEHKDSVSTKFKARINTEGNGFKCFRCTTSWGNTESMLMALRNKNTDANIDNTKVNAALKYVRTGELPPNITPKPAIPAPVVSTNPEALIYFPKSYLDNLPSILKVHPNKEYVYKEGIKFLISRKMPMQVIIDLDIRYDYKYQRVVFPNYNNAKVLFGLDGRYINYTGEDSNPKYWVYKHSPDYKDTKCNSTLLFYRHYQLDKKKPLVIVEGVFDVARIYQSYRNVTCLNGVHIPAKKLEFLKKFKSLIYVPDTDIKGLENVPRVTAVLPNLKVIVLPAPYKDASDAPASVIRDFLAPHLTLDIQLWTKADALLNL